MNVRPSTSFEATAKFPTALAGSLGVRVIDNVGGTTAARTTSGIAEYPAGSGIYAVTLTSPGSVGQYSLVWDDGDGHWAVDDLTVTDTADDETVVGSSNLYISQSDMRTILNWTNLDDAYKTLVLGIACNAASRAVDGYKKTRYFPTSETNYYTLPFHGAQVLVIDDFCSTPVVHVDTDNDGILDDTLVAGTDFLLEPVNAPNRGMPYSRLVLRMGGAKRFPSTQQGICVMATFGWSSTPWQVTQATELLVRRFLERMDAAPLGIVTAQAGEMISQARVGRIDHDAAFLLDQLPSRRASVRTPRLS